MFSICIVWLDIVLEQTHRLLKWSKWCMLLLFLLLLEVVVRNKMLRKLFLFFVNFRIPMHVKPFSFLWVKQPIKMSLEFFKCQFFKEFAFFFLTIKLILVKSQFITPVSAKFFVHVFVFFRVLGVDWITLLIKFFFSYFANFLKHFVNVSIEACLYVGTTFIWWLNHKPGTNNVSIFSVSRENDVSKLFNCSQLVKSWFIQKLQTNLVEQLSMWIFSLNSELEIAL